MNALGFIHLFAVGAWVGSIATEAVLEITLDHPLAQAQGPALPSIRSARFLAIPVILTVLFTGIAMLRRVAWDASLVVKVALAASAVVLHIAGAGPTLSSTRTKTSTPTASASARAATTSP